MNYIIDTKNITLNSKDGMRINSDNLSSVVFSFKDVLKNEKDILYTTVGLYSAEIPVSFYNINVNNYVLNYSVNAVSYSMTIPEGNYNATSFITAFQTQFASGGHSKTIAVSINRLTGIFTFTISGYTLIFLYANTTMYEVLGFIPLTNYTMTTTLTAPYMANLLGVKKLKIVSSVLANTSVDSNNLGGSNMIQTISVDQPAFGLITYKNQNNNYSKIRSKVINDIDIQIRDENDALIDFNGVNWSLTILLNIYRKFVELDDFLDMEQLQISPLTVSSPEPKVVKETLSELPNPHLDDLNLLLQ